MNFQSPLLMDDEYTEMLNIIAELCDTRTPTMFNYWAWPQIFPSTVIAGGVGGQAITTRTINAFTYGKDMVLFCDGYYALVNADDVLPVMQMPANTEWHNVASFFDEDK